MASNDFRRAREAVEAANKMAIADGKRALGTIQRPVLEALVRHGGYPGYGWVWNTHSATVKVLEALVKKGLVERREHPARDMHGRRDLMVASYYPAGRVKAAMS